MTWGEALSDINYVAVAVGAVISLIIGYVWYEPRVLGNQWMKLVGLKRKDMEDTSALPVLIATSIVFYTAVSIIIAALMELTGMKGLGEAALLGAILGFVFGFGPLAVTYGYARRSFDLTLIDGGYVVVTTTLIAMAISQIS